jgi:hypothetical protein
VAAGTALWVLAMLVRPHYAIVLAALPVVLSFFLWRSPRCLAAALAIFALVAGVDEPTGHSKRSGDASDRV